MRPIPLLVTVLLLTLIAGGGYVAWRELRHGNELLSLRQALINTPPPLRHFTQNQIGTLTINGVLIETNQHRQVGNLSPLTLNDQLSEAAAAKIADMLEHQYFDHVGPDGRGPSDWVDDTGYVYIAVGENLALGNFVSDAELVQAWMDSPGHRANILHTTFTEIGLAVGRGTFEGRETWLAVQTFAKPASACPASPSQLIADFHSLQADLAGSDAELSERRAVMDALIAQINQLVNDGNAKIRAGNQEIEEGNRIYRETGDRSQAQPYWDRGEALQKEGQALLDQARAKQAELSALQDAYNARVQEFNSLARRLQTMSRDINARIRAYNTCVGH